MIPPPDSAVTTVTLGVSDEAALAELAVRLAGTLPPVAFVALRGDLGAGKTTFVKAVAAAVGVTAAEVVSPTFGLIHRHQGRRRVAGDWHAVRIIHADMYRIVSPAELAETGWDDAVADADWVFVEWPERIEAALPAARVDLEITAVSPSGRNLSLTGRGAVHARAVAELAAGR